MTTYEPLNVVIERSEGGSKPNPPFDPGWSWIEAMQWRAGCIEASTGIQVTFDDTAGPPTHVRITFEDGPPGQSTYDIAIPGTESIGLMIRSSDGARTSSMSIVASQLEAFLVGLEIGAGTVSAR